jgi:Dullard-like phosphatase family protein
MHPLQMDVLLQNQIAAVSPSSEYFAIPPVNSQINGFGTIMIRSEGETQAQMISPSSNGYQFELPSQLPQDQGKLTVVLDIDETLIHTELITNQNAGVMSNSQVDSFMLQMYGMSMKVSKRPFLDQFLQECSKKFELIAFTAGAEDYATALLDQIDPNRTIFRHRLFRQHCTMNRFGTNNFIKDLRIVNRSLNKTVLVDNNAHSFLYQLGNGIPIASFFGTDANDKALVALHHFLDALSKVDDVRDVLHQVFRLEASYGQFVARMQNPVQMLPIAMRSM